MDDDEDSPGRAGGEPGARPTERPGAKDTGSALERYQEAIRQHREASDRGARATGLTLASLATALARHGVRFVEHDGRPGLCMLRDIPLPRRGA